MLKSYPAIFHEEKGSYWIEFPGFGGGTEGDSIKEAMKNAQEYLEGTLEAYLAEGMPIPKAKEINQIVCEDGFVTMIRATIA